jgi:hypothetical protein
MNETCAQILPWLDILILVGAIGFGGMAILLAGVLAISDTRKFQRQRWRERKERR